MKKSEVNIESVACTLRNFRSKVSEMNPEVAMKEHKLISEKIKQKKVVKGFEIIEEYEKLTSELLEMYFNEKNEKEKLKKKQ